MNDLPPMDPCPVRKSGRHELNAILPESSDLDATLFCDRCGAVRRFPVSGSLVPLDAMDVDEIERRILGRR